MDSKSLPTSVVSEGFCKKVELRKQTVGNFKSVASCQLLELCQELATSENKCRDDVGLLQANIERLRAERNSAQGDQHKGEQELAALSAQLADLQTLLMEKQEYALHFSCLAHSEQKMERDSQEQRLSAVQSEAAAKQRLLDEIIAQNKNCSSLAGHGVNLFEKHLGLSIRKLSSSNTTVFSFTQVQRSDPTRVFEVAVTLNGDRYELASDPPLPDLPALQLRLNQTNNLAGFLRHVRNTFKRID